MHRAYRCAMTDTASTRYSPEALEKHSNTVQQQCTNECNERRSAAIEAISFLGHVFETTETEPISLQRNVRLMLIGRMMNHLYAEFLLIERGLSLDAQNAARSAIESTAWYWLVCIQPAAADDYDTESSPRPVEIRKRLEKEGVDVEEIRDAYSNYSHVAHVGNKLDRIQVDWSTQSRVLIGGSENAEFQNAMFNEIVAKMVLFLRYDPTFEPVQKGE